MWVLNIIFVTIINFVFVFCLLNTLSKFSLFFISFLEFILSVLILIFGKEFSDLYLKNIILFLFYEYNIYY